ncbi:MAG: SDR family NAD(P)-dependent oxidoreductase [Actinobacteria bacterium]|nr:SDR family NAD(P)-dependent oxidoreductase [Actinomycetota bacterium]
MTEMTGKVALVTGGASGIGRATATRLAVLGAQVCVVDVSGDGKSVADDLGGIFIEGDVGDPDFSASAVLTCESELGGLDVAHFNAGVTCTEGADIAALTDEQYRRIMRVNVDGVVFGIRAAVPALERRGGGSIVVTASLAGLIGFPVDPIYTLTKHAVVGLVRSLPEQLTPKGIRINCVNPGIVATPLVGEEAIQMFAESGFPLLQPEDIADAVVRILGAGGTGECWPVQPGRDPEPYQFRQVPGPRTEGAEGMRPPSLDAQGPSGPGPEGP